MIRIAQKCVLYRLCAVDATTILILILFLRISEDAFSHMFHNDEYGQSSLMNNKSGRVRATFFMCHHATFLLLTCFFIGKRGSMKYRNINGRPSFTTGFALQ